eukprot:10434243-Heterocapsa_arctica.AAC.1
MHGGSARRGADLPARRGVHCVHFYTHSVLSEGLDALYQRHLRTTRATRGLPFQVDAHADPDERRDRGEQGSISRKDVNEHGAEHAGDAHRPHQGVESMNRTRDAVDNQ